MLGVVADWRMNNPDAVDLDKDPSWEDARREALERDAYTCRECGFQSDKYMEVHHNGGNHRNHDDMVTLCPLCHACHHIGFHGISKNGVLLALSKNTSDEFQSKLNRKLLEDTRVSGNTEHVVNLLRILPVENNLGAEGLVELGERILEGMSQGHVITPPSRLIFFPNPESFSIFKYIAGKKEPIVEWTDENLGNFALNVPYEEFITQAAKYLDEPAEQLFTFFQTPWKILVGESSFPNGQVKSDKIAPWGIRVSDNADKANRSIGASIELVDRDGRVIEGHCVTNTAWKHLKLDRKNLLDGKLVGTLVEILWFMNFVINENN